VGSTTIPLCADVAAVEFDVQTVVSAVTGVAITADSGRTALSLGEPDSTLTATATFADDSIPAWPVTTRTDWTSSQTNVLLVGSGTGVISAPGSQVTGTTVITGVYAGLTGALSMSVSGKLLDEIYVGIDPDFGSTCGAAITPNDVDGVDSANDYGTSSGDIAVGARLPLIAWGHYTDDTYADITSSVTFGVTGGLTLAGTSVNTTTAGAASVTATMNNGVADVASGANSLSLTLADYTVSTIEVSGPGGIPAGQTGQFMAMATYTTGSPCDVTNVTTWSMAPTTNVGSIAATGLVSVLEAAAASTSVIVTGDYGGVTDTATFTVSTACVNDVTVAPSTVSVAEQPDSLDFDTAEGAELTATVRMSNGTNLSVNGADIVWAVNTSSGLVVEGDSVSCPAGFPPVQPGPVPRW
jgi:hypothetical protein